MPSHNIPRVTVTTHNEPFWKGHGVNSSHYDDDTNGVDIDDYINKERPGYRPPVNHFRVGYHSRDDIRWSNMLTNHLFSDERSVSSVGVGDIIILQQRLVKIHTWQRGCYGAHGTVRVRFECLAMVGGAIMQGNVIARYQRVWNVNWKPHQYLLYAPATTPRHLWMLTDTSNINEESTKCPSFMVSLATHQLDAYCDSVHVSTIMSLFTMD
jgi:hypothetical protein